MNGSGALTKTGAGTLALGNAANTHTGPVTLSAGTLLVQGLLPSASVTVNSGALLGGGGTLSGFVTVAAGGTLSPGNSVGTLNTGSIDMVGTLLSDIDLAGGGADLLNVTGSFNLNPASTLTLALANLPTGTFTGTYLLVANDGSDAISGSFGSILGLPAGYTASVNYAFSGVDSLGRTGTGNDLAVTISAVPEPATYALMAGGVLVLSLRRLRRA